MATGASNLAAQQSDVFSVARVPKSANISQGHVVVWTSDSGDNKIVDIPTAATALLGGRAFAGISCGQGTTVAYTTTGGDQNVQIQMLGIAKCLLKASTACTRGAEAAYDPADGGTVVPYTSKKQIKIGRFMQTKSSSASAQFVEVFLEAGSDIPEGLVGNIVASSAALSANAETAFASTVSIPANMITVGSVIRISAKANVTAGATGDTLILRLKIAAITLVTTATVDVAANDVGLLYSELTIRSVGAAGTFTHQGYSALGAAGTATLRAAGSNSTSAIDTTAANVVSVTADWSADTADTVVLEDLKVSILRVSN